MYIIGEVRLVLIIYNVWVNISLSVDSTLHIRHRWYFKYVKYFLAGQSTFLTCQNKITLLIFCKSLFGKFLKKDFIVLILAMC